MKHNTGSLGALQHCIPGNAGSRDFLSVGNDIFTVLWKAGEHAGPLSVAHNATFWFWQKAINIGVQGHWAVYALMNSEISLPKVYYKEIIQKKAKVV